MVKVLPTLISMTIKWGPCVTLQWPKWIRGISIDPVLTRQSMGVVLFLFFFWIDSFGSYCLHRCRTCASNDLLRLKLIRSEWTKFFTRCNGIPRSLLCRIWIGNCARLLPYPSSLLKPKVTYIHDDEYWRFIARFWFLWRNGRHGYPLMSLENAHELVLITVESKVPTGTEYHIVAPGSDCMDLLAKQATQLTWSAKDYAPDLEFDMTAELHERALWRLMPISEVGIIRTILYSKDSVYNDKCLGWYITLSLLVSMGFFFK